LPVITNNDTTETPLHSRIAGDALAESLHARVLSRPEQFPLPTGGHAGRRHQLYWLHLGMHHIRVSVFRFHGTCTHVSQNALTGVAFLSTCWYVRRVVSSYWRHQMYWLHLCNQHSINISGFRFKCLFGGCKMSPRTKSLHSNICWSAWIMDCMLFTFENRVPVMR